MNPHSFSHRRKQVLWLCTCITIGAVVTLNPWCPLRFTVGEGWVAWGAIMGLVLVLTANPGGARVGVLLAGFFLAVPCCLAGSPLGRGLLMCAMAVPAVAATAFVVRPPLPGLRARLAYLFSWGGARQVRRQPRRFDRAATLRLCGATLVFMAALAVGKAVPGAGAGQPLRWLAGGILLMAFGAMLTAGLALTTAAVGVVIPPLMRSPHCALSVGEFWSDRWNIFAARKLFFPFCFQPLARRGGVALAVTVTFFVSAVAHVLLVYMATERWGISLLNGAFFMVQPGLIGLERWMRVRRWRPAAARAWTLGALAVTSPLFIVPGLEIVRASWGNADVVLLPTVVVLGVMLVLCGALAVLSRCSRGSRGQRRPKRLEVRFQIRGLMSAGICPLRGLRFLPTCYYKEDASNGAGANSKGPSKANGRWQNLSSRLSMLAASIGLVFIAPEARHLCSRGGKKIFKLRQERHIPSWPTRTRKSASKLCQVWLTTRNTFSNQGINVSRDVAPLQGLGF